MFNAGAEAMRFTIPRAAGLLFWRPVFDTVRGFTASVESLAVGSDLHLEPRSVRVLEGVDASAPASQTGVLGQPLA
jgi:hypothetical protein